MNGAHSRRTSQPDRRSADFNGFPSTTESTRGGHYKRPSVQNNGSPVATESANMYGGSQDATHVLKRKERLRQTEREEIRTKVTISPSKVDGGRFDRAKRPPSPKHKPHNRSHTDAWQPEVRLEPCSEAPLAVRVTAPPLRRDAPEVLDLPSLRGMSMLDQENVLVEDLLSVFMGHEGQYVTFPEDYDPSDERCRLAGPKWTVASGLDPSLRDLIQSMLAMASQFIALQTFTESHSRREYGLVNHALCAAIRRLLKDYLILVVQLESRLGDDHNFTLHQMHLSLMPTANSISHLYALAQELLKKNSLVQEDVDESLDDFDADNIIDRLREGGDLLPGSMTKKKCIGGNVLALLSQRLTVFSGDPQAKKILEMLLREASKPYMSMLNEWLHHGGIQDPHDEFLIGERQSIKRERLDEDYTDEYWDKRYYVREKEIPPQLLNMKDKILLAGKYLNVVRECGGINITSDITSTPTTFDDARFVDNINQAYAYANKELLSLMLAKSSLRTRLVSIKHYFFLDQAEFFLYFLELSDSELSKPRRAVNIGKLQSLLDLVIHQPGSIAATDSYKDDVRVGLNELGLVPWLMKIVNVQGLDTDDPSQIQSYSIPPTNADTAASQEKDITGHEALELDYSVPFPLSLIISRKTITRYQLILRYTLSLRHLEQTLIESWSEHNKAYSWTTKSESKRIEIWKRRAWNLRARMLIFVQQMLFYATAEVLEPQFEKLMVKVDTLQDPSRPPSRPGSRHSYSTTVPYSRDEQTVDSLIQDHLDMLDTSLKDLGLTQSKLLKILSKMTAGCNMFASYTSNLSRNLYSADPSLSWVTEPASRDRPGLDKIYSNFETFSKARNGEIPAHDPARLAKIEDTLGKHEEYFNRHLKVLIDTLNYYAATETVTLLGLCGRLMSAEVQRRDD